MKPLESSGKERDRTRKIPPIETPRLLLRGFTKEDALWAFRIWNDPEVGKYLPDEPMLEPDPEYIRELEKLGDDEDAVT